MATIVYIRGLKGNLGALSDIAVTGVGSFTSNVTVGTGGLFAGAGGLKVTGAAGSISSSLTAGGLWAGTAGITTSAVITVSATGNVVLVGTSAVIARPGGSNGTVYTAF